jgi:hypothetical protein
MPVLSPCSVCRDTRVFRIDAETRGTMPAAYVARRYGVSEQALRRHIRGGHVAPPPVARAAPARQMTDAEWFAHISEATGIPAADIEAHYRAGHHVHEVARETRGATT